MKNFSNKYLIYKKWICRLGFILFILSLIPLLFISPYDHPCADDFSYGNRTISTWRESGSLPQTIEAAVKGTKEVYAAWQGSFVAVFFMTLHPAVFGDQLYMLVPILLLLGFAAAMFFLLKVMVMDYWSGDKYDWILISSVLSFLSIQFVISPVEGFYWYNGAMYYTGFHSLSLVLFAALLTAGNTRKKHNRSFLGTIVVIASFLIGGSNFITALTTFVIISLFLSYRLFLKREGWGIPLMGLLALGCSLLISVLAPGNAIRQESFQGMNPAMAILQSFSYALLFIKDYVPIPVCFAIACLLPVLYRIAGCCRYSFRFPGLVTMVLYGVYASSFTPNLYAMSSLGGARIANLNYFYFLFFLLLTLFYWCGWIRRKKIPLFTGKTEKEGLIGLGITGLLAGCFLFGCILLIRTDTNSMATVSAARSLVKGEAKQYHLEYQNRLALYTNPDIEHVNVPGFSVKPYVLFVDDITPDPDDWRNRALAKYYNKKSVVLK